MLRSRGHSPCYYLVRLRLRSNFGSRAAEPIDKHSLPAQKHAKVHGPLLFDEDLPAYQVQDSPRDVSRLGHLPQTPRIPSADF